MNVTRTTGEFVKKHNGTPLRNKKERRSKNLLTHGKTACDKMNHLF